MIAALLLLAATPADDWPRFRGPAGMGVAAEGHAYPAALDTPTWKVAAPPGNSSPVVVGDRIYLTAEGEGDALFTLCYARATGEELWRRAVEPGHAERLHDINSPASSTPCADAERVVSFFGTFGLVAYSPAGEELWRRPVDAAQNTFGTGASAILEDGHVFLARDVNGASFLEALDAGTGDVVWRVDRSAFRSGWSTPSLGPNGELLVYGATRLVAYDRADGRELWSVPGLTDEPIVTPLAWGGKVYVSSYNMKTNTEVLGLPPFAQLVDEYDQDGDGTLDLEEAKANASVLSRADADGEGDHPLSLFFRWLDEDKGGELDAKEYEKLLGWVDSFAHLNGMLAITPGDGEAPATIAWQHGRGVPECPSPLIHEGRLYFVKNGGMLTCLDAASGELRFEGRTGARGPCYASPVAADGKVYTCSARGTVAVLKAGDELEVLSLTDLGERIMATPALVGGRVLVRTDAHLVAFE